MRYRWIAADDAAHAGAAALRHEVLRAPLGFAFAADWGDAEPGVAHVVAEEGERVVGYGWLQVSGDSARARYICVAPGARGLGVGTGLVRAIVERARGDGVGSLWLNSRVEAEGFYTRLGFTTAGGVFETETGLPHVRMEMRLG